MSAKIKQKSVKEHALNQESFSTGYWVKSKPQARLMQEARCIVLRLLATSSDDDLPDVVDQFANSLEAELSEDNPNLSLCRMWFSVIRTLQRTLRRENLLEQTCQEALVKILVQTLPLQFDQESLFVDSVVREIDLRNEPF